MLIFLKDHWKNPRTGKSKAGSYVKLEILSSHNVQINKDEAQRSKSVHKVFCSILQLTVYIILSLGLLLSGIYLYETKKAVNPKQETGNKS